MRMSARFVGNKVGMDTKWVYDLWEKMGVVTVSYTHLTLPTNREV